MRIQNNLMAMNTHRQLSVNNLNQSKSTEKLSSGYRINRAADDAAGLTISEKMRAQIRGLNQASANAQDGISLVQAAEGALQETHSILQRMRELAVKAANDINETEDRGAIKKEIDQLTAEIDRISSTTEFNKKSLLDGSLTKGFYGKVSSPLDANINAVDASNATGAGDYTVAIARDVQYTAAFTFTKDKTDGNTVSVTVGANTYTIALETGDDTAAVASKVGARLAKEVGNDFTITVAGSKVSLTANKGDAAMTAGYFAVTEAGAGAAATLDNETAGAFATVTINGAATTSTDGKTYTGANVKFNVMDPTKTGTAVISVKAGGPLTIQVGANTGVDQTIAIDVVSLSSSGLGLDNLKVDSHLNAQKSVDSIEAAIQKVSDQRSALGAVQNRLEHTIANLDTVSENLTAAESRIRDVDMAKEMMAFTKNNILTQAATAMLAQANQAPQTVLQLLR